VAKKSKDGKLSLITKAEEEMSDQAKRVYYGSTTEQQRRYMIGVYEATGNKSEACRRAKVCRGTFYRWYPRYQEGGWEAIKAGKSRAVHTHPNAQPPEIVQRVLELNEEHPDWGLNLVI
jgi:transposase